MKLGPVFALLAVVAFPAAAAPPAQIDHILLGIDDLDRGVKAFEEATGVKPVYGGRHPRGTHNALVSLGHGTYVEIIAVQKGATPPEDFAELAQLHALTPIGWAVSSKDSADLLSRLKVAGMAVTDPAPGSRVTPAGKTLSWQTFNLKDNFEEAPFFIVWSAQTAHPSTTSPGGCTLQQWRIAGPHRKNLEQLRRTLELRVDVADAKVPAMQLALSCPKGAVTF
ncbi:MAG TPA: VOC family protein [Steroidobacteraceae bacterium]|nr:VOC family protein [Steroidobacteraceae bacterium]